MSRTIIQILFTLLCSGIVASVSFAAEKPPPANLAVDVNLYPYMNRVDNDTDLTVTISAPLPGRFSYFSYLNFRGVFEGPESGFFRSEQNLRWNIVEDSPIDLNVQAVLVDGDNNDALQLGVSWRLHDTQFMKKYFERLHLKYRLSIHLKRYTSGDDSVWQMEHFFRMTFPGISDRLYLSGFLDQSFDLDVPDALPKHPIVTEVQFGMRLFDRFYAVTEYRKTDFRLGEERNLAVGIEYKFRW